MKHQTLRRDRWIVTMILCIGMAIHAGAQSFTQRIQKKVDGQGTVTIHHSQEIDRLVNVQPTSPSSTTATKPSADKAVSSGKSNTPTPSGADKNSGNPSAANSPIAKVNAPESSSEAEVDMSKKVMRNAQKVMGYRVKAFAGGNSRQDRQNAERTRNAIKAHYPHVPVYVHFYSPRWICRVGNYRTYEEAHHMLVNLQRLGYKQASIVKGKITVQY